MVAFLILRLLSCFLPISGLLARVLNRFVCKVTSNDSAGLRYQSFCFGGQDGDSGGGIARNGGDSHSLIPTSSRKGKRGKTSAPP